ncbi:MAG: 3-deoxy-7-phosphoheptulonate synthase [Acidobacteria bacterium 13_1_20CM_2_57_8]|nr:MAG: 3-deoxy-7-phosphoheptulonate synthase [Acidobacteria bacterium 13_1_20CM_2_57_8]PYS30224.1 MAG: 3-deoxy-7-phosphoheptulonate synthase [Acidobacteriota bacterium]
MVVVMQEGASEEQVQNVIDRLIQIGFDVHRSTGASHTVLGAVGGAEVDPRDIELLEGVREVVKISASYKLASRAFRPDGTIVKVGAPGNQIEVGGRDVVMMAGPCTVESAEQIMTIAGIMKENGIRVLRGGAFKPRTSPYSFQGMGEEGLKVLRKAADKYGLLVVSEIMNHTQIPLFCEQVDILQVGARNMQNFDLLKELAKVRKPVLLKRGPSATIEEWLLSAEYIMTGGNHNVMLCERGIRTFENYTRNTLDISAIPVIKKLSHLPVLADPSHGTGRRDKVPPMARAAVAAGADGLLIEVHHSPETALCDGAQSLYPAQFRELMSQLEMIAPAVQRSMK